LAHDRHIPDFNRFLQFAAPTFDVSIFEIFFPLFRERTIVSCSRIQMLNDLPGVISELEVDAAELTPTVVGNLLGGRASVPGLKLLLTIGEMLTRHVVEEYGGNSSRKSILWGMYGKSISSSIISPSFDESS
jgi:non-ribosomal peptide synthetase component F